MSKDDIELRDSLKYNSGNKIETDTMDEFLQLMEDDKKKPKKEKVEKSQTLFPARHPELTLKYKLLSKTAKAPQKAFDEDLGFDLFVDDFELGEKEKYLLGEDGEIPYFSLHPGEIMLVKTGVAFGFPKGWGGFLKGRSSLAKLGINILGGVIDNLYVGHVIACLSNNGFKTLKVEKGQKIVQMVLIPSPVVKLEQVKELKETDRNDKGFGSSGK